jgi:hypothetical protein
MEYIYQISIVIGFTHEVTFSKFKGCPPFRHFMVADSTLFTIST